LKKTNPSAKVFSLSLKGRQRFLRLFGESSKPRGVAAGRVMLKPGESIGQHNTNNRQEALIILQGEAEISYGQNCRIKVKKNTFVYIPPQTEHNLKNVGKCSLRYVYLTAS